MRRVWLIGAGVIARAHAEVLHPRRTMAGRSHRRHRRTCRPVRACASVGSGARSASMPLMCSSARQPCRPRCAADAAPDGFAAGKARAVRPVDACVLMVRGRRRAARSVQHVQLCIRHEGREDLEHQLRAGQQSKPVQAIISPQAATIASGTNVTRRLRRREGKRRSEWAGCAVTTGGVARQNGSVEPGRLLAFPPLQQFIRGMSPKAFNSNEDRR
jgi:hypothetical protein